MEQNSSTPVVGIRLKEEERLFLETLFPGLSPSKAIKTLLEQTKDNYSDPKSVFEAQERLLGFLQPQLNELLSSKNTRTVVTEDIVRDTILILATILNEKKRMTEYSDAEKIAFEHQIIDRAFDLVDTLLRHTLPEEARAWDPQIVRQRLLASRRSLAEALSHTASTQRPTSRE